MTHPWADRREGHREVEANVKNCIRCGVKTTKENQKHKLNQNLNGSFLASIPVPRIQLSQLSSLRHLLREKTHIYQLGLIHHVAQVCVYLTSRRSPQIALPPSRKPSPTCRNMLIPREG